MRLSPWISAPLLLGGEAFARLSLEQVGKGMNRPWNREADPNRFQQTRQPPTKRQEEGTFKFLNENTTQYAVDGKGIPEVDFDVGESYAGQIPIGDSNPDSNLFFWFFPSENPEAEKEIMIWLNGGPGCSSLEGFLQENGPFLWQYGTIKPVTNPWSWHTLTNMIWVEQPVGTGFSQGTVTAENESDVAEQFLGFWKNIVDTFSLHDYKVYIAGESYAGLYCPYIASAMLDEEDTEYFDMSGMLIYDPVINDDPMTEQIPAVAFTDYWAGLFPFNDTFRAYLHDLAEECGYTDFMETYLVYPPSGPMPTRLPGTGQSGRTLTACNAFGEVIDAALLLNPCFNLYHAATTCPLLHDVLGFPGTFPYLPPGAEIYFDRSDVKAAIHAPEEVSWALCTNGNVFVGGDDSAHVYERVLPHVIEATNNVIISHGALDFVLLANGTLLAIQNMTWGGEMGFQSPPVEPFFVPYHEHRQMETWGGAGVMGTSHTERGLTYVGVDIAGHMVPQYAPSAAYRQVEVLLGRVESGEGNEGFTVGREAEQPPVEEFGMGTAPPGWSGGLPEVGGEDEGHGEGEGEGEADEGVGRRNVQGRLKGRRWEGGGIGN